MERVRFGGNGRKVAIIGTLALAGTAMATPSFAAPARTAAAHAATAPHAAVPVTPSQAIAANGVGSPFELAFWQSVDGSSDPALYDAYLNRFPNGTFSEIARVKQQALHAHAAPVSSPAPVAAPPVAPTAIAPPVAAPAPAPTMTLVAAAPVAQPAAQPAVAQTYEAQPVYAQPAVVQSAPAPAPAVVPTSYVPAPAPVAAPAASGAPSALGQLLAALANSQGVGNQPSVDSAAARPVPVAAVTVTPVPVAPRFVVPSPPPLAAVPPVVMPRTFCSAEERNAFHDSVYVNAVNLARRNNEATVGYMRQLQELYDQHQLSHDPETMNLLAAAARDYQPVTQNTFGTQSMLVQMFNTLMAVPIMPCTQVSQAGGQPMPGSAR